MFEFVVFLWLEVGFFRRLALILLDTFKIQVFFLIDFHNLLKLLKQIIPCLINLLKFSFYIEKLFPLGRDSTLKSILLFGLLLVNLQWVLKEFLQIVKCFSGYYLDFSCLLKEFFVFLDHRIIFGIFLKEPCLILKFPSLNIQ